MGLGDDGDDRSLRETLSKKKRKEIVPSLFPHLTGSQLVISMAESEREADQVREIICQFLASMMTDCCATGALITIKRALSHTLFLLLCLLSTAQGKLHAQTHTQTALGRGPN